MPSLSFKKRFASKVRSGEKKQTIRAYRKIPIKIGDRLYLYTGLRTKYAKKLAEATCCDVVEILITETFIVTYHTVDKKFGLIIKLDGLNEFAIADGFKNFYDMRQFWLENNELPFQGNLIIWNELTSASV